MCIINLTLNGMVSCSRLKLGLLCSVGLYMKICTCRCHSGLRWWIQYTHTQLVYRFSLMWAPPCHKLLTVPGASSWLSFFPSNVHLLILMNHWFQHQRIYVFNMETHSFVLHSYWWQGCCIMFVQYPWSLNNVTTVHTQSSG